MKKNLVEHEAVDHTQEYYEEYLSYLAHLFSKARDTDGMEYIYTLLRVSGIEEAGWDPFIEAREALIDFSRTLRRISKRGFNKSSFRMGLLIYCHSVEMSAPYEILYNLLRCSQGKTYVPFPFPGRRLSKKRPYNVIPRSPKTKLATLKLEGEKIGEEMLISKMNSFFDDEIRNAFYHSDYALTESELRICGPGLSRIISFEVLSEKLARCFAFYQAFFDTYRRVRLSFRSAKRFHRLPNFEVFELLTDRREGLIGFRKHFSNDSQAYFERRKERVWGVNLELKTDHIGYFAGDLDKLQRKWMVDGKMFRERNTRYNSPGTWSPILFYGKTNEVIAEVRSESSEEDVQGCLFYIKCTGHESIEFVVKANKPLAEGHEITEGRINATLCECSNDEVYVYDCTYNVNSIMAREVKKGINRIRKFIDGLRQRGFEISYVLKYHLGRRIKPPKDVTSGSFSVSLPMDDPRNTLCTSDFRALPKTDWKIRPEWIE